MINQLAIKNYRSLRDVVLPLGNLNIITGPNGSGKSNIYKSLKLLSHISEGGVISALAREGGINSVFWAGQDCPSHKAEDEFIPKARRRTPRRVKLGFNSDDFSYIIELGYPVPSNSLFQNDPQIKRESIWYGHHYKPSSILLERDRGIVKIRDGRSWVVIDDKIPIYESIFSRLSDPLKYPEVLKFKQDIKDWRFYDSFRVDQDSPCRSNKIGTFTPYLSHDGGDLASVIQTIKEFGDVDFLKEIVNDAFPGCSVTIEIDEYSRFSLLFNQKGFGRPLHSSELSDGTIRFLCWIAALISPYPPKMMVLNEPEASLHPNLIPALAKLIIQANKKSQIWIISHSTKLVDEIVERNKYCHVVNLDKTKGETGITISNDTGDYGYWKWP